MDYKERESRNIFFCHLFENYCRKSKFIIDYHRSTNCKVRIKKGFTKNIKKIILESFISGISIFGLDTSSFRIISPQLVTRDLGIVQLSFGDFNMMWLILKHDRSDETNNLSNLLENIIALGSSSFKSRLKPPGFISLLTGTTTAPVLRTP